jgi:hypothetical protein
MSDNTIVSAPAGFFQADQVNNDTAADLTSAVLAAQANIDGAITAETNAAASAAASAASATTALGAQSSATAASTAASSSASGAAASATTATTQATNAGTSASAAAASAVTAGNSATTATTQATNASSSATAAASSATAASTAATNAAASAALAAASIAGNIGRNFLHNSLFTVQQRGAGPFTANGAYTADRWKLLLTTDTNSVSAVTLTDTDRSAIGDEQAAFALQHAFTGASSANAASAIVQPIEGAKRLSNKQINISFWARTTVGTPQVGVSITQHFGTGGSSDVVTGVGVVTLTSSWVRYGLTVLVPSASGKTFGTAGTDYTQVSLVGSDFSNTYGTGVGAQTGTIQYWGVQVEDASIAGAGNASPLEKRDPGLELALCQRFYATGNIHLVGFQNAGSGASQVQSLPEPMRANPTLTPTFTTQTNCGSSTLAALSNSDIFPSTAITATNPFVLIGSYTASADL